MDGRRITLCHVPALCKARASSGKCRLLLPHPLAALNVDDDYDDIYDLHVISNCDKAISAALNFPQPKQLLTHPIEPV